MSLKKFFDSKIIANGGIYNAVYKYNGIRSSGIEEGGITVDTSYENKMYKQIEQKLSDNDKLFVPVEIIDENNQIFTVDEYKEAGPKISRAEYIRMAREACLRQMDESNTSSRLNDIYYGDDKPADSLHDRQKRARSLFSDGSDEEVLPEDVASYRSLIIRTVFALVIFLTIFVIDKLKVDMGLFSYENIRQYVTGSDKLKALEEILVSWFK
ncbi:MAG: hypothetical protein GX237_03485 [Clostridiales bacterium]|nr:hypothetical protein [Clostridiales bacterium]